MLLNRQKEWGMHSVVHREKDGTEETVHSVCVCVCVCV